MTRIVFIGAGSVEFTRNLLGDILTFPELADATIVLHDIDPERLETAAAMARWTIGRDMAELCPDAWLLNYTNPMAMNVWAYDAGSPHKKIVGLCHSIQNTSRQISEYVGVPFDEVTFAGAGVNHMAWVLRFERDGVDLYPRLDEAIAADPDGLGRHVRVQVYKLFGYFPTESSEHFAEYVPWFMRDDAEIARLRIPVREYIARSEENIGLYREERRKLAAGEPFEIERSLEYASLIVHSMVTGTEREIYGNVPNRGLIGNLPRDAAIEVPCRIDARGVHPMVVGDLPPQCAALDRTFLNVAELTVRAALEGRRDHVLQAVLLDPNAAATLTVADTVKLVDEMLAAHRDALPAGLR